MDFSPEQEYNTDQEVIYYAFKDGKMWCESSNLAEVYRSADKWDTETDEIVGREEGVTFHRKTITHHIVSVTTWEEM